jgi:hypothetical protein
MGKGKPNKELKIFSGTILNKKTTLVNCGFPLLFLRITRTNTNINLAINTNFHKDMKIGLRAKWRNVK